MPSFTATDQIVYAPADGVTVDDALFLTLQEETYLLIESCTVAVEQRSPEQRFRPDGTNFLTAYDPGQLVWSVRARCAAFLGLADYHPGAALSRQALSFANGPDFRVPFQFEDSGILVYEKAQQEVAQGTLPAVSFSVRMVCGGSLDEVAYPVATVEFVTLPAQASMAVHEDGLAAAQEDIFMASDSFDGESMEVTLYDGDPEVAGVALMTEAVAGWTDTDEPVTDSQSRVWNGVVVDWTDVNPAAETATHIRVHRNGITLAVAALAAPLEIPAGQGVRAAIGSLAMVLTWPWDGGGSVDRPAGLVLRHMTGDTTAGITTSADLNINCYDDDPAGIGILLDTYTVTRNGTNWDETAGLVANIANLTGADNAPGGGWTTEYVTVTLTGVNTWFIKKEGTIVTSAGNPIVVPTGALDVQAG